MVEIQTNREELLNDFKDLLKLFFAETNDDVIKKVEINVEESNRHLICLVKVFGKKEVEVQTTFEFPETTVSTLERKRTIKRQAKLALYKGLAKELAVDLPWGSLTGVRPTRVAYDLLEQGVKEHILRETLMQTFGVSKDKADLVTKVIKNQNCIIRNEHLVDLYVNIPICPSRCSYCSFISSELSKVQNILPKYVEALIKEIREIKKMLFDKALVVRTIYVGGGTPTVLSAQELDTVLGELSYPVTEFTVECGRADTITEEKLKILKKHNVTRISINPQTFCESTLKRIGRKHKNSDIYNAYKLAMQYGFDVNMDFIAGLPSERFATFKKTIDTALELFPENITVHTLSLKNGSELKDESEIDVDVKHITKMLNYANSVLISQGYKPYYIYRQKNQIAGLENVGYYRDNKICIFNVDSMEETCSIVAVGANAISKRVFNMEGRIERSPNVKFIEEYIDRVDEMIKRKKELFR